MTWNVTSVKLSFEPFYDLASKGVHEHDLVMACAKQDVLAVRTELQGAYLVSLRIESEGLERLVLVVLGVEQVDHLLKRGVFFRCTWFHEKTSQKFSRVVKACSPRFVDFDKALLFLVLPDSSRSVLGAAEERRVHRVQVNRRNRISVANEAAQDVVVMK